MTEAEWLACTDLGLMLAFLNCKVSLRKYGLFACACCRQNPQLPTAEDMPIKVVERYLDGVASKGDLTALADEVKPPLGELCRLLLEDVCDGSTLAGTIATLEADLFASHSSREGRNAIAYARYLRGARQCNRLHDLIGNPYRSVSVDPAWLAWNDGCVVKLAQAIYDEQDYRPLPILRAALIDAGCTNEDILRHCIESPEHFRGCWVIDLLLGIDGNPFRSVSVDPAWLAWNDGTVPKIAQRIYDERNFGLMPILGDALEEAGCSDPDVLSHCRRPGEHVHDCWVIDLLSGRG